MKNFKLNSTQIVYSEHHYDECFEYKNGKGRVPEGAAVGYEFDDEGLVLFRDVKYSDCDHKYWDNYELEFDVNRIII
jgi:hypothetical protein